MASGSKLAVMIAMAALVAAACGGSAQVGGTPEGGAGSADASQENAGSAGASGTAGVAGTSDAGDASDANTEPDVAPPDAATGSCTGAPGAGNDCGPGSDESCCASLPVTGGTFSRSYDGLTPGHQDPQFTATVSGFSLDRFEVTVGRFRAFIAAYPGSKPAPGAGAHPKIAGSGWRANWDASLPIDGAALAKAISCKGGTWTPTPDANEKKPVTCVEWYLAFAFCVWDGGRLPTEAEWNYAAAGGDHQLVYPFSAKPMSAYIDATLAVYQETAAQDVGSKSPQGDGRWGQADLAGNAWEWTLDAYNDPYVMPCNDCALLGDTDWRVARGGTYGVAPDYVEASVRGQSPPDDVDPHDGFRCAR